MAPKKEPGKKPKEKDVGTSLRGLLKNVDLPAEAPPKKPPPPAPSKMAPSEGLAGNDRVVFQDAMVGVRPLKARTKAQERRQVSAVAEAARHRGSGADDEVRARLAALVSGGIRFQIERDGERVRGWRADTPPREVLALEGRGVVPEASLDLHGMRADQATRAVVRFIRDRHRHGVRRVCVVHGKGLHSEGGLGVLSDRVIAALTEGGAAPVVLAFATAPPELGGAGALIVQLTRR